MKLAVFGVGIGAHLIEFRSGAAGGVNTYCAVLPEAAHRASNRRKHTVSMRKHTGKNGIRAGDSTSSFSAKMFVRASPVQARQNQRSR